MELLKIDADFTICKLNSIENVDFSREFIFLSKTDDEISLVCQSDYLPTDTIKFESGWKALKISGMLDFGLIGIIAKISSLLAEVDISIFVISTYNTDYILLKALDFNKAIQLLESNSYVIT